MSLLTAVNWLIVELEDLDFEYALSLISDKEYKAKKNLLLKKARKLMKKQIVTAFDIALDTNGLVTDGEKFYQREYGKN